MQVFSGSKRDVPGDDNSTGLWFVYDYESVFKDALIFSGKAFQILAMRDGKK